MRHRLQGIDKERFETAIKEIGITHHTDNGYFIYYEIEDNGRHGAYIIYLEGKSDLITKDAVDFVLEKYSFVRFHSQRRAFPQMLTKFGFTYKIYEIGYELCL